MDKFLTPAEVAEKLRIEVRTLQLWRKKGRGPSYYRLENHTIRYRLEDVDAWLEQHAAGAR